VKTHTSLSSPLELAFVVPEKENGSGWVAITIAPGKKTLGTYNIWNRDLEKDLNYLKESGATVLVPLLEDEELKILQIHNLIERSEEEGLKVLRFPIRDSSIPQSMKETIKFIDSILNLLKNGERIVVHCNGGLGRAGTVAACIRLALGLDGSTMEAIRSVRRIRSIKAIETPEQEEFIHRFFDSRKNLI